MIRKCVGKLSMAREQFWAGPVPKNEYVLQLISINQVATLKTIKLICVYYSLLIVLMQLHFYDNLWTILCHTKSPPAGQAPGI